MNNVILAGRLTADPELKTTQNGIEFTKFSVAVKRDYSKDNNQPSDFINITAWRQTAAFICKYFAKGDGIVLSGKIQTGSYQTNTGEKRYTTEVIAEHVEFPLGKRRETVSQILRFIPKLRQPDFRITLLHLLRVMFLFPKQTSRCRLMMISRFEMRCFD